MRRRNRLLPAVVLCLCLRSLAPGVAPAKALDPLVYTIRFPDPASRSFAVDVVVPTARRPTVDLMMAIWSPGFYGLQNYAQRVSGFTARAADGTVLEVTR